MKKICIVVEYDDHEMIQLDVINSIINASHGRYAIIQNSKILPSQDRHENALFKIKAFTDWALHECAVRKDNPHYIDEYLHDMVNIWYRGGGK